MSVCGTFKEALLSTFFSSAVRQLFDIILQIWHEFFQLGSNTHRYISLEVMNDGVKNSALFCQ